SPDSGAGRGNRAEFAAGAGAGWATTAASVRLVTGEALASAMAPLPGFLALVFLAAAFLAAGLVADAFLAAVGRGGSGAGWLKATGFVAKVAAATKGKTIDFDNVRIATRFGLVA